MKCLYCGAKIPAKDLDTKGRKHTKKSRFCRGTNHYRLWWNRENKAQRKLQDRKRYLKLKAEKEKNNGKGKKTGN